MNHPYRDFLLAVEKPARYLGGEYGSARPPEGPATRIALAFPDTYEIGMCFQGFHILYHILQQAPAVQVERVFSPWPDMEKELRIRKLPLVSLETATPLNQFDVVGFSLQHELSFTNILAMLDLGGIPLLSQQRSDRDPLIIAGGPVAFQPEPMADFMDLFVLGDGEAIITTIMDLAARAKASGLPRPALLKQLSALPGIYVPSLVPAAPDPETGFMTPPQNVQIGRTDPVDLAAFPFPTDLPVADTEIVFDRYAVEIARGCNGGCRFCQGGFAYRPLRLRSRNDIIRTVQEGLEKTGFHAASLTSLSTADYPGIAGLTGYLADVLARRHIELSFSSLRAYDMSEELMASIGKLPHTTLTFALEAGTQRLRNLINKNVVEENILKTAEKVFSRGWRRIKLYFMIGLPTETDDDVKAIINVTKAVRDVARRCNPKAGNGVTASVSTFVPKPHTPFQWEPMLDAETIHQRQRMLFQLSKRHGISLKWHNAEMTELEGVMARGDRSLGRTLLRAFELGCRFDGWTDCFDYAKWRTAFADTGIDVPRYLGGFASEAALPWRHLSTGVTARFLAEERRKAFSEDVSAPCFFDRVCHGCGALCDLDGAESFPDPLPNPPPPAGDRGKSMKYRIAFRRFDRLRYISQLDVLHLFPKVFRRAGLTLAYTKGFKPKPVISFAPALPLGAAAIRDVFDVGLEDPGMPGNVLVEKLGAVSPRGLEFLSVRPLREWEKKLSRRIAAIDTAMALAPDAPMNDLEKTIEHFLEADSVVRDVPKKNGETRRLDLRDGVFKVSLVPDYHAVPWFAGPVLMVRAKPDYRPALLFAYLCGEPVASDRLYRADLFNAGAMGLTPIR